MAMYETYHNVFAVMGNTGNTPFVFGAAFVMAYIISPFYMFSIIRM
jgi:hypothetical protein